MAGRSQPLAVRQVTHPDHPLRVTRKPGLKTQRLTIPKKHVTIKAGGCHLLSIRADGHAGYRSPLPPALFAQYLDQFIGVPRQALIARLIDDNHLLEAETLLQRDVASSHAAVAAPATAQLAELLTKAGRTTDAAVCYRRLSDEFADVVCRDGKTGQELLSALPDTDPVKRALAGSSRKAVASS